MERLLFNFHDTFSVKNRYAESLRILDFLEENLAHFC